MGSGVTPEEPGHDPNLAELMAAHQKPELNLLGTCQVLNCLESYVCEWGIMSRYRQPVASLSREAWQNLVLTRLAFGIVQWQRQAPTDSIVMGGAVPRERDGYIADLTHMLAAMMGGAAPYITLPHAGKRAALLGAATAALQHTS